MRFARVVFFVLPVLVVGACGGNGLKTIATRPVGCEEAVGQGVSVGEARARLVAQSNLSNQVQELKAYMMREGYRSVRMRPARVACRAYALGLSLTQCVAKAQLCSR